MSVRRRIEKYSSSGGRDLVKVEVLVRRRRGRMFFVWPQSYDPSIAIARNCAGYATVRCHCTARACSTMSICDRLPTLRARAGVIARALMERGDARAFVLGRENSRSSRVHLMALTDLQMRIIAAACANRSETSYLAGGVIPKLNRPRVRTISISFTIRMKTVARAALKDIADLESDGFCVLGRRQDLWLVRSNRIR